MPQAKWRGAHGGTVRLVSAPPSFQLVPFNHLAICSRQRRDLPSEPAFRLFLPLVRRSCGFPQRATARRLVPSWPSGPPTGAALCAPGRFRACATDRYGPEQSATRRRCFSAAHRAGCSGSALGATSGLGSASVSARRAPLRRRRLVPRSRRASPPQSVVPGARRRSSVRCLAAGAAQPSTDHRSPRDPKIDTLPWILGAIGGGPCRPVCPDQLVRIDSRAQHAIAMFSPSPAQCMILPTPAPAPERPHA